MQIIETRFNLRNEYLIVEVLMVFISNEMRYLLEVYRIPTALCPLRWHRY